MNIYYITAFVAYFAFFLGISIFFYSRSSTPQAFLIGDRSMNYWVTALTTQASDMSDWLFMAYPGLIYGLGLFNAWVAIGLTTFMFINWHFIAPRLRVASERLDSITLGSFFERHFRDHSGLIRCMSVIFTTYFIVYYIGAELVGLGRLFEATFMIPYNVGISLSITLVVANIIIGGFTAAAWSDALRGIFLVFVLCLVPIKALIYTGPQGWCMGDIPSLLYELVPDTSLRTLSDIALLSLGWGLGYLGSPHILMNYLSIKNADEITKSKYVGLGWMVLALSTATIVGMVGSCFFETPLTNRELVFIEMVKELFHPLVAGFMLCAVLAATMSVMTAQILATASVLAQDGVALLYPNALTDKQHLRIIRVSIIALPLLAYTVSYSSTQSINDLIAYAWSGLGLAFGPTVVASLYSTRAHKTGVYCAMALGGLMGMVWPWLGFSFLPLLPGFFICLSTLLVISSVTRDVEFC